jgi:trk system potassium uptake protein TrkA
MFLIVVGAGAIAQNLISLAVEKGHKVVAIDKNEDKARILKSQYDIQVFHADIAKNGVIDKAGGDRADALIATTHDDSVNLMAIFLAKDRGIENLLALVNNNEHQEMFERLGARVIVNPEKLIADRLLSYLKSENS